MIVALREKGLPSDDFQAASPLFIIKSTDRYGEIPMKEDKHTQEICAIWIDHINRIISFRKEDGFEPQAFSSPDERMQYALEKSTNGYRVQ